MADRGTHVVLAMSEHLTDVQDLTPEQEARATALTNQMTMSYWVRSAARVIVHLQDEVARLREDLQRIKWRGRSQDTVDYITPTTGESPTDIIMGRGDGG